jgi:mersacidin/lichenicidin family type 2 lantibiotic
MARSIDVVRAWKDQQYLNSLTADEKANLPAHPIGAIELHDADVESVPGGSTEHIFTIGCCGGLTTDPGACSALCPSGRPSSFDYSCKLTY